MLLQLASATSVKARLLAVAVLMAMPTVAAPAADPAGTSPHGAPAPAPVPIETIIARFGGETITAADLDAAIRTVPGAERLEYTTAEPLRELTQALVDRRLMARAARQAGLHQDPAKKAQLEQPDGRAPLPEQVLAETYLQRELDKVPAPTTAQIEGYYREHAAEFTVPVRARVIRVVAATEAAAERLRGELARGATLQQIRDTDPAHIVQLDEVWIQDRPKKNQVEIQALRLKPGAASPVFQANAGFMTLRVEEMAPAKPRPLVEVREGIDARLREDGRQAAALRVRAELRKGVTVTLDEPALMAYAKAAPTNR